MTVPPTARKEPKLILNVNEYWSPKQAIRCTCTGSRRCSTSIG